MGFIHATPGDIKSFKSSAERMALMVSYLGCVVAGACVVCRMRGKLRSGALTIARDSAQLRAL